MIFIGLGALTLIVFHFILPTYRRRKAEYDDSLQVLKRISRPS